MNLRTQPHLMTDEKSDWKNMRNGLRFQLAIAWAVLVIVGCYGQNSAVPVATSPIPSAPIPSAPEISPGDRPHSIRKAQYLHIDDYIDAIQTEKLASGDWACIEGRVSQAGEMMGADYLTLHDSDGRDVFRCWGGEISRYRFGRDMNVIVHFRLSDSGEVEPSLITQQEVDAANAEERRESQD